MCFSSGESTSYQRQCPLNCCELLLSKALYRMHMLSSIPKGTLILQLHLC